MPIACPHQRKKSAILGLLGVVALGLLIWTRLRLVSPLPRTVYAEPSDMSGTGRAESGSTVQASVSEGAPAEASVPGERR